MLKFTKPFIIYEMANNHQGSVEHGKLIINSLKEASHGFDFDFAVKFQYRNLDTFIHPDFKDRMDLKFVKRFSDTRLSDTEFLELKKECENVGFKTICTPFDEDSVVKVVKHNYDYIKIASCSVRDWPLLEEIVKQKLPIISSSGGATMEDMDKLVSFFEHKDKDFALMHCVGIYPTENDLLQLNRIDWFKQRYPNVEIGFSTHETPGELYPVSIAVAKGVMIFEKHVGVESDTIKLNDYSCTPAQVKEWLKVIEKSFQICGVKSIKEHTIDQKELDGLKDLKRGVFAKKSIANKSIFSNADVFFAMPKEDDQMTSEEFSKHHLDFISKKDYKDFDAIKEYEIKEKDIKGKIASVIHTVKSQLSQAKIVVNKNSNIELSHHYGIERIDEYGAVLIDCINEEYCKKIIVLIPNQTHPEHYHIKKKESFQILYGELYLEIDGVENRYIAGDIVTVDKKQKHAFRTLDGVVFEEVSTTHYQNDSVYSDESINNVEKRKTNLKDWWLKF